VEILEQAEAVGEKRTRADALADRILPGLFNRCFGEPTTNPKGWPTHPLLELADFVSGATPSKENAAFWNGKIPWVSPKDMKREELYDSLDHISEAALAETNLKLLPSDTTLIVVRGMILAHTVPVCLARVPVTINQDMKGLRPKGGATPEFLQWALLAQHSGLLRLVSTAAHGTRKLDINALGRLLIPVPPAPQRHLIKKWTGIVREQQASATKRAKCREFIEQIWRTLLHRAFMGELTAQWREAHMKELLAEMEQQARLLRSSPNGKN
jgi:type I restriction enzyme S subunit